MQTGISNEDHNADKIIDGLFRGYFSKAVAALTRIFGTHQIELAEEVVQESLLKAVMLWRINGIPQKPEAWLYKTAKNLAIDALRREKNLSSKKDEIAYELEYHFTPAFDIQSDVLIKDDQLKLLFISCHPLLSYEAQLCLTLKVVAGLSVEEIARAFLSNAETIAQRIVRAKRKIREARLPFELPPPGQLPQRLDAIFNVIYLLFNEGYGAMEGEQLVREDVCAESVRLMSLLLKHPLGNTPKAHALMALMLLQVSRIPARVDKDSAMVLLPEQDRSLWDQNIIRLGIHHLKLSKAGNDLSTYHLQAGIAASHSLAVRYEETDWQIILWYYDKLVEQSPSPIFALNRAIALSFVKSAEEALIALEALNKEKKLQSYYLYFAILADMQLRCGQKEKAVGSYIEALSLAGTKPEKDFLLKKINVLK